MGRWTTQFYDDCARVVEQRGERRTDYRTAEYAGVARCVIPYHSKPRRGNPFFVEEIVRMLIDQGVLVKQDGCWRPSEQNEAVLSELASPATPPEDTLSDQHCVLPLPRLPDTVQGVLAARVDLLSQVEKQELQDAAIIGRTFWLAGLLELAAGIDREALNTTIEALIQREFIIETEKSLLSPIAHERVYSFKQIIIIGMVYHI